MAASSSLETQDIPLLPSPPSASDTQRGKSGKKSKGKRKAKETGDGQKKRSTTGKAASSAPAVFEDDPLLNWVPLTDPMQSKAPPIFTKDGSYYFVIAGSTVKIFATATGQLVSTLSSPPSSTGAPEALTTVILNPQNIFQIITGSVDGSIRIWDYLDATLIKTLDIGQPIQYMCSHEKHQDFLFVSASKSKKSSEDSNFVLRISLKATDATAQSANQKSSDITPIGKTRAPTGLAISPSGNWLVTTAGPKSYVANLLDIRSGFTKYVSPEKICCLAFHPVEDYFATGDEKGIVRLWYCLNGTPAVKVPGLEKKTQTTSFHWHAHAVSSLAFTANGAYLLSGGEESVLVLWQLHSGKREFVPRLGAPIHTISVTQTVDKGEEYLLSLTDATFVFVSATSLKMSRSYSRVKLVPETASTSSRPVPLAVHPSSSTFILPSSHASSVQMYSLTSLKIVSELEVSPSNRVSRRDEKPIEPSRVERTVLSPSGEWMASIDTRQPTEDFQGEFYMKIWRWDRKTSLWILNTRIDRPHGIHNVTDISFSPRPQPSQESILVTAGGDGAVKTWRLRSTRERSDAAEEFWVTRSSFSFQSGVPSHVSWSPDGSILAVTLGQHVSLFDALTNIHRTTFASPECSFAKAAYFVGRGRFLAIQGEHEIILWDIVSHSVRWTFVSSYPIYNVVPHPDNESFAVITSAAPDRSRVHVFSPSSSHPSKTTFLPFTLRSMVWYSSKPSASFSFAGVTQDWRFVFIGDDVKVPEEEGTAAIGLKSRSPLQPRTLFQDIFGKSIFEQPPADASSSSSSFAATFQQTAGPTDQRIFDVPAYLAPPVESLFDPLMMGLLKLRSSEEELVPSTDVAGDEDVEMEVDNAEPPAPSRAVKVDNEEMESLVSLFKTSSIQTPPLPKTPKVNGVVKVNGVHPPRPSPTPSSVTAKSSATKSKPAKQVQVVSPDPTPSPTVNGIGKKRKKAVDYL